MRLKNIIWISMAVLVMLFSSGCGAGLVPQDPTLPWEGTQTVQPPSQQGEPTQTDTLPAEDPPTATLTPSETSPPVALEPSDTPFLTAVPSDTPTQPPAAQVAPSDSNFNNPLNIPLDATASVTDFVSFPGGDTTDRVRYDVTGMNPNASLSGGRARLVIAVSCFGSGIDNVTFFIGGQTYTCGQTIVDQEITSDSRTGQVTIQAIAGENTYVQWVLTGTATRIT